MHTFEISIAHAAESLGSVLDTDTTARFGLFGSPIPPRPPPKPQRAWRSGPSQLSSAPIHAHHPHQTRRAELPPAPPDPTEEVSEHLIFSAYLPSHSRSSSAPTHPPVSILRTVDTMSPSRYSPTPSSSSHPYRSQSYGHSRRGSGASMSMPSSPTFGQPARPLRSMVSMDVIPTTAPTPQLRKRHSLSTASYRPTTASSTASSSYHHFRRGSASSSTASERTQTPELRIRNLPEPSLEDEHPTPTMSSTPFLSAGPSVTFAPFKAVASTSAHPVHWEPLEPPSPDLADDAEDEEDDSRSIIQPAVHEAIRSAPGVVGIGEGWAGGPAARAKARWFRRPSRLEEDPLALWDQSDREETERVGKGVWNRSRGFFGSSSPGLGRADSSGPSGIQRVLGVFSKSKLNLVDSTRDSSSAKPRKPIFGRKAVSAIDLSMQSQPTKRTVDDQMDTQDAIKGTRRQPAYCEASFARSEGNLSIPQRSSSMSGGPRPPWRPSMSAAAAAAHAGVPSSLGQQAEVMQSGSKQNSVSPTASTIDEAPTSTLTQIGHPRPLRSPSILVQRDVSSQGQETGDGHVLQHVSLQRTSTFGALEPLNNTLRTDSASSHQNPPVPVVPSSSHSSSARSSATSLPRASRDPPLSPPAAASKLFAKFKFPLSPTTAAFSPTPATRSPLNLEPISPRAPKGKPLLDKIKAVLTPPVGAPRDPPPVYHAPNSKGQANGIGQAGLAQSVAHRLDLRRASEPFVSGSGIESLRSAEGGRKNRRSKIPVRSQSLRTPESPSAPVLPDHGSHTEKVDRRRSWLASHAHNGGSWRKRLSKLPEADESAESIDRPITPVIMIPVSQPSNKTERRRSASAAMLDALRSSRRFSSDTLNKLRPKSSMSFRTTEEGLEDDGWSTPPHQGQGLARGRMPAFMSMPALDRSLELDLGESGLGLDEILAAGANKLDSFPPAPVAAPSCSTFSLSRSHSRSTSVPLRQNVPFPDRTTHSHVRSSSTPNEGEAPLLLPHISVSSRSSTTRTGTDEPATPLSTHFPLIPTIITESSTESESGAAAFGLGRPGSPVSVSKRSAQSSGASFHTAHADLSGPSASAALEMGISGGTEETLASLPMTSGLSSGSGLHVSNGLRPTSSHRLSLMSTRSDEVSSMYEEDIGEYTANYRDVGKADRPVVAKVQSFGLAVPARAVTVVVGEE